MAADGRSGATAGARRTGFSRAFGASVPGEMSCGFQTASGRRHASLGALQCGLGASSGASRSRSGCGPVRTAHRGRRRATGAACPAPRSSVCGVSLQTFGASSPRRCQARKGRSSAKPAGARRPDLLAGRGAQALRPRGASNERSASARARRREGLRAGVGGSRRAASPTGNSLASVLVLANPGTAHRGFARKAGAAPPRRRRSPSVAPGEIGTRPASLGQGACRGVFCRSTTRTAAVGLSKPLNKPRAIGRGRQRTTQPGCGGSPPGSTGRGGAEGIRFECGRRNGHTATSSGGSVICPAACGRAGPSGISSVRPSARPGRTTGAGPDNNVRGEICTWERSGLTGAEATTGLIRPGLGATGARWQPGRTGSSRDRTPADTALATASSRAGSGAGPRLWGAPEAMGNSHGPPAGKRRAA